jgi:hypothetical protein
MDMYAKFQINCKHRYLRTINLVSGFLEFCTKILPCKNELGQAHREEWFKRIHTKI